MRLKNGLLKIIPGERFTPFSLAQKLGAKVILESASFHRGRERWSVLLLKEAFRVLQDVEGIFLEQNNKRFKINSQARDILDVMLYFAQQHSVHGYDFPIPAGGIGYVSYEAAARFDKIHLQDKPDSIGIPESYFIVGSVFLIFDHYTDSIIIMALNYKENPINLEQAIGEIEDKINDLDFNFMNMPNKEYEARIIPVPGDKENYMEGVKKVREEIIKGNLIQGVLSRRVFVETDLPALEAYRNLRSMNPSPYLFLLDFDSFQIFGSSPEVHVKVKNKKVEIRPIAGTRKRGKDEQEELALEKDLLSDEKELAEHLMLVDLARNDIGRVCVPGSVHVTENMVIEKYSHVMHIVSQVEGVLEKKFNGTDLLRATFPAGTVSGAPKISAIEILDKLEPEKRSFYAGVVGWLEANGSLNSCIAIRTALKRGNKMILQAGAGIVYDSDPEKEYEETQNKLRAAAEAIGVEV
ncbi:MAG: anthranilate synthase component I [Spirochaetales bacterium]|nr:anthranilate synthase component I [Spirochaetales bacterium]